MTNVDPLVPAIGVLVTANVMNNRVARRWAPVTSAVATAALLAVARREGLTWPELGFVSARRGAAIGGAFAAGVAGVYAAGIAVPRTRPLFHDQRALALSRARLLEEVLVQVPFGTVLLEEVGFRGVLPALLGRVLPPRTAVAASAALFGLWHVLPALDMAGANPTLGRLTSGGSPRNGSGSLVEAAPIGAEDTATPAGTPFSGGVAVAGRPPEAPPVGPRVGPGAGPGAGSGVGPGVGPGAGPRVEVARLVAGTVASTALAGALFQELRRRGGLLAPSLLHLATNSFGYVAARVARKVAKDRV